MSLKSERLKKLESELGDLEQWLKLSLVPKKDILKHKEEIEVVRLKIEDELERLRFLKENGESEEYVPPKRPARANYQELQSIPDMPAGGDSQEEGEGTTTSFEADTSTGEETQESGEIPADEAHSQVYSDDDDPFSDRNRWKRGILEDPYENDH